ncbi:MAG: thermonuclease family protein [Cyanobacteria bacterium P01_C01_bin.89]
MGESVLELVTTVKHVADGDTIIVPWDDEIVGAMERHFNRPVYRAEEQGISIRLFGLDAPEMGQEPWGQKVKERLAKLLSPYDEVTLQVRDMDSYSRLVAEVFVEGFSVNVQLVAEGCCVAFFQWLRGTDRWADFAKAHDRARHKKVGIWGDENFISPGEWRHQNRAG